METTIWPCLASHRGECGPRAVYMIEIALVGRLGADAISAAGVSNELAFFVLAPIGGLSVGGLALVARAVGRRDQTDLTNVTRAVLLLACAASVVFMVLMLTSIEGILQLISVDPQVVTIAVPYAQWFGVIHIGSIFMLTVTNLLRGIGDTRSPMIAFAIQAFVTGVVGYVLVFDTFGVTGLGVLSIAVAAGVSRIAACGYLWLVLRRSPLGFGLWAEVSVPPKAMRRVIRTGGPAALEEAVKGAGKLILSIAAIQFGSVAYAAYRIVGVPISITFLSTVGMGLAVATMVGQSLGANHPHLAQRYIVAGLMGGFILTIVPGIVFFLIPAQVLTLLTTDVRVVEVAESPLRILGIAVVFNAVGNVLPAALRGAGDTKAMMVVGFLSIWVARVPVALALAFGAGQGILGLWMGHAAEILFRSGGALVRFKSNNWHHPDL